MKNVIYANWVNGDVVVDVDDDADADHHLEKAQPGWICHSLKDMRGSLGYPGSPPPPPTTTNKTFLIPIFDQMTPFPP